jgi:hypothetical protein
MKILTNSGWVDREWSRGDFPDESDGVMGVLLADDYHSNFSNDNAWINDLTRQIRRECLDNSAFDPRDEWQISAILLTKTHRVSADAAGSFAAEQISVPIYNLQYPPADDSGETGFLIRAFHHLSDASRVENDNAFLNQILEMRNQPEPDSAESPSPECEDQIRDD